MKIYLAGGYLKSTGDFLCSRKANRLFSFYDLQSQRVNMLDRFNEVLEEINEDLSGDLVGR
jgi:hypothetical protein